MLLCRLDVVLPYATSSQLQNFRRGQRVCLSEVAASSIASCERECVRPFLPSQAKLDERSMAPDSNNLLLASPSSYRRVATHSAKNLCVRLYKAPLALSVVSAEVSFKIRYAMKIAGSDLTLIMCI